MRLRSRTSFSNAVTESRLHGIPGFMVFFKVFSEIIGAQTDDCTTKNEILYFSKFFRLKEIPVFGDQQVPSQHQNGSNNYGIIEGRILKFLMI